MKAENQSTGHNRTIKITEIDQKSNLPTEITITVTYKANENIAVVDQAVLLDKFIIPQIVKALNTSKTKSSKNKKS